MGIDLVTLAEYKAYADINSNTQDTKISSIIPKVSELVKNICRRTFVDYVDDAKTEYFDGGEYLPLAEYPVLSVQSVEYSTDFGQTYTAMTEFTDYYLHKATETIKPVTEFVDYSNGYKVTYTAGFEVLPQDLKIAVLDLVTYYLKNDGAVHSPKAPGTNTVQIEYITTTSLPAHIKRVLDLYVANYL